MLLLLYGCHHITQHIDHTHVAHHRPLYTPTQDNPFLSHLPVALLISHQQQQRLPTTPTTQPPTPKDLLHPASSNINHFNNKTAAPATTQHHQKTTMPLLSGISTGYQRLSKYLSKAARKRLPLSPKRAGKGFYKGNKCASTGRVDSIGTSCTMKTAHVHIRACARRVYILTYTR